MREAVEVRGHYVSNYSSRQSICPTSLKRHDSNKSTLLYPSRFPISSSNQPGAEVQEIHRMELRLEQLKRRQDA